MIEISTGAWKCCCLWNAHTQTTKLFHSGHVAELLSFPPLHNPVFESIGISGSLWFRIWRLRLSSNHCANMHALLMVSDPLMRWYTVSGLAWTASTQHARRWGVCASNGLLSSYHCVWQRHGGLQNNGSRLIRTSVFACDINGPSKNYNHRRAGLFVN